MQVSDVVLIFDGRLGSDSHDTAARALLSTGAVEVRSQRQLSQEAAQEVVRRMHAAVHCAGQAGAGRAWQPIAEQVTGATPTGFNSPLPWKGQQWEPSPLLLAFSHQLGS